MTGRVPALPRVHDHSHAARSVIDASAASRLPQRAPRRLTPRLTSPAPPAIRDNDSCRRTCSRGTGQRTTAEVSNSPGKRDCSPRADAPKTIIAGQRAEQNCRKYRGNREIETQRFPLG